MDIIHIIEKSGRLVGQREQVSQELIELGIERKLDNELDIELIGGNTNELDITLF